MSHLTDRLAEFVLGELSSPEMTEARRHLNDCPDCRARLNEFQQTYAMLKTSPDVEPPRRIIFEVEKPRLVPWIWRWLAPMAASAAVALAVVSLAPRPEPQIVERIVQQPLPGQPAQPAVQPVDYDRIVNELRASNEAWLAKELQKRDDAQAREIQRVRGELELVISQQWGARRDNAELMAMLQPLISPRPEVKE